MIELHRVSKVFSVGPVKVPALTDVSFRIAKGEFVVLHGPSGAGKTTLLRLLYRAEVPTEGEVEVLGQPLGRRSALAEWPRSAAASAWCSRTRKLLPGRTVYENIAFVLRVLGTPRGEITARAFDALRAVGLHSRARGVSRAALAGRGAARRARARDRAPQPALLIADEPTGNLDDGMAAEILQVIRDIHARRDDGASSPRTRRASPRRCGGACSCSRAAALVKDEG